MPKLAQATLIDTIAHKMRTVFEPRQMSVRVPGGAETLARTLRGWLEGGSSRVLLQVDLKNAYGQMYRSKTLEAVRMRCPELAPPAGTAMGPGSNLGVDPY